MIQEGLEHRWIDVYENVGKRSGGYMSGAMVHPYILLNYQDDLDSMFTLAHELGHAIHSYLSNKTQPTVYRDYVIFVAEVASTCNEALLMEYLLNKTTDPKERAWLLNHFLEQFKGTLYRQTMFAEFELKIGQLAWKGKHSQRNDSVRNTSSLTRPILEMIWYLTQKLHWNGHAFPIFTTITMYSNMQLATLLPLLCPEEFCLKGNLRSNNIWNFCLVDAVRTPLTCCVMPVWI